MIAIASYQFPCLDPAELSDREETLLAALEAFAEIEFCDPRLMVVVAAARMESSLTENLQLYVPKVKRKHHFQTKIETARKAGAIDEAFYKYLMKTRKLRNYIAHNATRQDVFADAERWDVVEWLHDETSCVPIWGRAIEPAENLRRSLYASMLSGVLAAELDFFDNQGKLLAKGFRAVAAFALGGSQS